MGSTVGVITLAALQADVVSIRMESARKIFIFAIFVQLYTCLRVYLFTSFLYPAILIHALADDGETIIPEFAFGDIDAEAFGKFSG